MKNLNSSIIFGIVILILLQSCSSSKGLNKKIILTRYSKKDTKEAYNLTESEIKRIQFYSGPENKFIILKGIFLEESKSISEGKLTIYQKIDSVLIRPFTKGKVISIKNDLLSVSFEQDSLSLVFGPSSKNDGYVLYVLNENNETYYGSRKWKVVSGQNEDVRLYFDLNKFLTSRKRSAKGNTIN